MTPSLALQGITKRFASVTALDQATLTVRPGTVHALLGENGAGKTTLMRVAFGMVRPDAGIVSIEGRQVSLRSPADAIAAGVGMVHQHFALVPTMTVAENVALGGHGRYSARRSADEVRRIGDASGLLLDPDAIAGELSVGGQQRLEIVKALARHARILILDEPTAVLAPAEVNDLLGRLRVFADGGRSVVLITHKLREALSIADEVTVLRRGATVYSAPSAEASEPDLVAAILGRPGSEETGLGVLAGASGPDERAPAALESASGTGGVTAEAPHRRLPPDRHEPSEHERQLSTKGIVERREQGSAVSAQREGDPGDTEAVFLARNLTLVDTRGAVRIRDASFAIGGGGITGIAAVEGSGHHELLRALAGRLLPASGTLSRPATIGFVPEDRQGDALILDFPLTENIALRDAGTARGIVHWASVESRTRALLDDFDVRASGPTAVTASLSGGNQQKLVLARELEHSPAALIAENPTRGLDILASADVHARLRRAAASGTAVVVHSSDLDELLVLAGRMLVVFAGTVREVPMEREAVGRGMLGLFPSTAS